MEQENAISTKAVNPSLVALLIWIFTSLALGTGWLLYSILFGGRGDIEISILVTVCAAVLSLPVFIALCIAIRSITDSGRHPTGKIKRLLLTCLICTLPYAFIISGFIPGNDEKYNYPFYLLHLLAISGILFLCSVAAILVTWKFIKRMFYTEDENEFLINQIGSE